ncbi:Solute carrier organic anion transporter family member 3A1 [Nymphon striatum]|nr:Solute carrier organic anion transporter family member 3A1 [Nymphon striatum]
MTEDSKDCGFWRFRPQFLQKFANIQVFVFISCLLVALQQMLSSGYFNSVITTIEKRFDIPSAVSGTIASTYEIGNLVTIIFVSYLGTHRHIPVWIGKGTLLMGVGAIFFALPHFIDQQYNFSGSYGEEGKDGKINITLLYSKWDEDTSCKAAVHGSAIGSSEFETDQCADDRSSSGLYVFIFMLAQILIGCGGSPIFTLGTTYIDDHVKKESSSMYIGCIYSMVAFGLVCGYLLGGVLLSIHHNILFFEASPMDIYPGHPRWIGAWWGGFLICGFLLLLVSIPFFSFPKSLDRDKKKVKEWEAKLESIQLRRKNRKAALRSQMSEQSKETRHKRNPSTSSMPAMPTPHHIPKCMMKLLCNPVYVVTCLGACMELAIVSGFVIFLPKYLETQFSLSNSQANLFTGGIAIPGACVGIFMGGYLLKRFQLGPQGMQTISTHLSHDHVFHLDIMSEANIFFFFFPGAVQLVLICIAICMTLFTLFFFLGCENVKMAGATMPYYNTSDNLDSGEEFRVNLTADCNMGCRCTQELIEPVCGRNGLTYFSPCHAGCTAEPGSYPHVSHLSDLMPFKYFQALMLDDSESLVMPSFQKKTVFAPQNTFDFTANFSNCACIPENATVQEVTAVPVARNGVCPNVCEAILPFMVLLFVMTLVVSLTQMPLLMIMLRSVDQDERSFALGMQFVIFRVFAYIPAPILFGNVIDSTCILWKAHCGQLGGLCLVYNIEQFRHKYVGISSVLKVISGLLFLLDWYLIRRRYKEESMKDMTVFSMNDAMTSLSSLDLSSDHLNHQRIDDMHPLADDDESEENENESYHQSDATSARPVPGKMIQFWSSRIQVRDCRLKDYEIMYLTGENLCFNTFFVFDIKDSLVHTQDDIEINSLLYPRMRLDLTGLTPQIRLYCRNINMPEKRVLDSSFFKTFDEKKINFCPEMV